MKNIQKMKNLNISKKRLIINLSNYFKKRFKTYRKDFNLRLNCIIIIYVFKNLSKKIQANKINKINT
jgi:hypothetical protein